MPLSTHHDRVFTALTAVLDEKPVLDKHHNKTIIKMLGVAHGLNESSVLHESQDLQAEVWKCRRWHDMGEIETYVRWPHLYLSIQGVGSGAAQVWGLHGAWEVPSTRVDRVISSSSFFLRLYLEKDHNKGHHFPSQDSAPSHYHKCGRGQRTESRSKGIEKGKFQVEGARSKA